MQKRIYFINRFYYPDYSATSQLLVELTESLVDQGDDIRVITSRQLYEDSAANLPKEEFINNIHVYRLYAFKFGRNFLVGRALDYLSFYVSLLFFLLFYLRKGDIVVAKTDPPLISVIVACLVKFKKITLINWIQDLFPEVANELRPNTFGAFAYNIFIKLRNWSLKVADENIVIGKLMKKRLIENGVDNENIKTIQNWHVGGSGSVEKLDIDLLKKEWGLQGKFIVGYSGNLGRAHEFQAFLDAAKIFIPHKDIVFVFIGGGVGMEAMKDEVARAKLPNIVFKSYQPLAELNKTLSLIDVHLISLCPNMEGLIVPSKFYGIVAANRPVIFIGAENGEIANIVNENNMGFSIQSGDGKSLVEAITQVYDIYLKAGRDGLYEVYSNKEKIDVKINVEKWRSIFHAEV